MSEIERAKGQQLPAQDDRYRAIWRHAFSGLAGLSALATVGLLIAGKPTEGFIAVILTGLLIVGSRASDLIEFGLTRDGMTAKLRTALDEARATVGQLQFLAAEMAKVIVDTNEREGRWGGTKRRSDKYATKQSVLAALKSLGVADEKLREVETADDAALHFDYAIDVRDAAVKASAKKKDKEAEQQLRVIASTGFGSEPAPGEFRSLLSGLGVQSDEVEAALLDYEHYHNTKSHRRPAHWLSGPMEH